MATQGAVEEDEEDQAQDETWESDWGENEGDVFRSLFSSATFPSAAQCCEHDSEQHGFDIRRYRLKHRLDEYGTFKCINYIRTRVQAEEDPVPSLHTGPEVFEDIKYLQPVLLDDALLQYDFSAECGAEASPEQALRDRIAELEAQNDALTEALQQIAVQALPAELLAEDSTTASQAGTQGSAGMCPVDRHRSQVDKAYFGSYAYLDIHREMLADSVRTSTYRNAIEGNPRLFKDATVLDVGCGTTILSMFAARAGAAAVVAVDAAERVARVGERVCESNRLHQKTGGAIRVVTGTVEDMDSKELPNGVDVIVSEWMGYMLLFESMAESVMYARDKLLKPGGAVLPDKASMLAALGDLSATGLDFWDDVYGFSFAEVREEAKSAMLGQPVVAQVPSTALMTGTVAVWDLDLMTAKAADLDFSRDVQFTAQRGGDCHCVVLWFENEFSGRFCRERPVTLSTSPSAPCTHWAQTTLVLDRALRLEEGEVVWCRISVAKGGAHRSLDVSMEMRVRGREEGSPQAEMLVNSYTMRVSAEQ